MQDDRPPRRGKDRRRGEDKARDDMPGMDSGFFARDGFEAELDAVAFENTALNNMDPIREAQLFEQFEQDYRSGGYDPGPEMSGYHAATDSGYHEPDYPAGDRPRHGKNRDRRGEGGPRIPMFARKNKPAPAPRPSQQHRQAQPRSNQPRQSRQQSNQPKQQSPFGELTPYLLPILAAVVVVMVIVVLLLNR